MEYIIKLKIEADSKAKAAKVIRWLSGCNLKEAVGILEGKNLLKYDFFRFEEQRKLKTESEENNKKLKRFIQEHTKTLCDSGVSLKEIENILK